MATTKVSNPDAKVAETNNGDASGNRLPPPRKLIRFGDPDSAKGGRHYTFTSLALLLLAWIAISALKVVPPLFWPTPWSVIQDFYTTTVQGYGGYSLPYHILISLFRVFAGFILACIAGIPLGLGMGLSKVVKGSADPIIELYRPVPPLAYVPLVIIWMGIGNSGKILVIFLAAFAIIVINARAGASNVPLSKIRAAYSLGANKWQVLWHVILINSLPEIFTGMRVAMGISWGTLVAAEMVAARSGLGWMVINASRYLLTDIVVMGIMIMGVLGFAFDLVMRILERRLIPWKGQM